MQVQHCCHRLSASDSITPAMADPHTDHDTASDPAANYAPYDAPSKAVVSRKCVCNCSRTAVSSHIHASGSNAQAATSADLPLRQSLQRSQNAYVPKFHDITEKFTQASKGKLRPSMDGYRGTVVGFVCEVTNTCLL